jgi:hypothetical protein
MQVELRDKSRDRLGDLRSTLSKPGITGAVVVKCDFLKVEPTYLQQYESSNRSPGVATWAATG